MKTAGEAYSKWVELKAQEYDDAARGGSMRPSEVVKPYEMLHLMDVIYDAPFGPIDDELIGLVYSDVRVAAKTIAEKRVAA